MNELSSVGKQAAFAAGIETARQMALTAAVTIDVRDDAREARQQAAAAALRGLAGGLRTLALEPSGTSDHCISVVVSAKSGLEAGS